MCAWLMKSMLPSLAATPPLLARAAAASCYSLENLSLRVAQNTAPLPPPGMDTAPGSATQDTRALAAPTYGCQWPKACSFQQAGTSKGNGGRDRAGSGGLLSLASVLSPGHCRMISTATPAYTSTEGHPKGFENQAPSDVSNGIADIKPAFDMRRHDANPDNGKDRSGRGLKMSAQQDAQLPMAEREGGSDAEGGPGKGHSGQDRAFAVETQVEAGQQSSALPNERINIAKHPPDSYSDLHAMNSYPPGPEESDASLLGSAGAQTRAQENGASLSQDPSASVQPWAGETPDSEQASYEGSPKQPVRERVYVDGHSIERKAPQHIRSEDSKTTRSRPGASTMDLPEVQSGG